MSEPATTARILAATSGSVGYDFNGRKHPVTIWVRGNGTISGGVISIEECRDPEYASTWSLSATVTASDLTGDKEMKVNLAACTFRAVRGRISTTITGGGSVDIVIEA